ncbi:probable inactive peptidyl-prolyl cis-trans isomerase-like 6 [Ptychodera flava]|uniref:probable inactive peptidyl-prolyl cis-trans isomerase-like 6 n=1 Tax=Ptychodera flava TaxID=63121 RepID=UPI00396A736B
MADGQPQFQLLVVGLLRDETFHQAKCCAEGLYQKYPDKFATPQTQGLLEFAWETYIDGKRHEVRGETWAFNEKAICFLNGQLIGGVQDFMKWAVDEWQYEDFRPTPLYFALAEEAYKSYLTETGHTFIFMDIAIGDEAAGRFLFELFTDKCPKTCENFRALSTGENGQSKETLVDLHYKKSIFHRIVPNGWIQGGDIEAGRGTGGESIYGPVFEDENFAISHDKRGVIGMANKGRHTNGSQFYITFQPAKWMDTKYVAFGQVVEGTEVLKKLEEQETYNERPKKDCKVTDCGIFNP